MVLTYDCRLIPRGPVLPMAQRLWLHHTCPDAPTITRCVCMLVQTLKVTGNGAALQLPVKQLAGLPALRALHVDRPLREALTRDPAGAPLLHWLRF